MKNIAPLIFHNVRGFTKGAPRHFS